MLFVCIFIGAILVRLYEDIKTSPNGGEEMAREYLGLNSSDAAVGSMIVVCFIMLTLLVLTVSAEEYFSRAQRRREARWNVATTDPPTVKWGVHGVYVCFLSVRRAARERSPPAAACVAHGACPLPSCLRAAL